MLFSYHLLYFCTALSLIIMLSSHYHHHKSKTFSQLTQCPFTGTLLLFGETLPSAYRNILLIFYCIKMSSHQATSKPRSSKCRHFCFPFDRHNYCPTCRESGKGDDPCVTNLSACNICDNLTDEQRSKIKNRHWYTRKQRSNANTSKEDLDLLGDDEESFTGTQADLEGAAETLFSSPPRPQPLQFESVSLKTPRTVSHLPQVLHCKIKLKVGWRNPWEVL